MAIRSWITAIAALLAAASGGFTTASHAQPAPTIDRISASEMQKLVQSWGYRAELVEAPGRDPLIRSAMSGANVVIFFYNCAKEGDKACQSIQFSAGFTMRGKLQPFKVNEWNQKQRYLKAFYDKDNEPYVQYDISLAGGVSQENVRLAVKRYENNLNLFMTHIDFKK